MAILSSHILDAVSGDHAAGIRIVCHRIVGDIRVLEFDVAADKQGRIHHEVMIENGTPAALELVIHSADYFTRQSHSECINDNAVLTEIILRPTLHLPDATYHFPIVLSRHSHTLWWSSPTKLLDTH